MFDLTSSKLLILALVTLIVVKPKDLPVFLRAVGKYMGAIRRQAAEFRSHFDAAMREHELAEFKTEAEKLKRELTSTVSAVGHSIEGDVSSVRRDLDHDIAGIDRAAAPAVPASPETPAVAAVPLAAEAAADRPSSVAKSGA